MPTADVTTSTHHMVRYQCSPAFPNQWLQTYWFVVEGDEAAARAEFDRVNTITEGYGKGEKRGLQLRGIHPCDARGN